MAEKSGNILTCKYDRCFKAIFNDPKNKDLLCLMLEDVLGTKITEIKYLNQELLTKSVKGKIKHLDMIIDTNIGRINVEVNSSKTSYFQERNYAYICKVFVDYDKKSDKKYNKDFNIIQINICYGLGKKVSLIRKYRPYSDDFSGLVYLQNFVIFEINMDKLIEYVYNEDKEAVNKHKYLSMMVVPLEKFEFYFGKERNVMKFMEEVKKVNMDPEYIGTLFEDDYYADGLKYAEARGHKEGREKGREEGEEEGIALGMKKGLTQGIELGTQKTTLKIADAMLKNNFSFDYIQKLTGLSLDEIKSLQTNLVQNRIS